MEAAEPELAAGAGAMGLVDGRFVAILPHGGMFLGISKTGDDWKAR
jgi:hypothetical protein